MPRILYSARDELGQSVNGRLDAPSLAEAREALGQQGLRDVQFHTVETDFDFNGIAFEEVPLLEVSPEDEIRARMGMSLLGFAWLVLRAHAVVLIPLLVWNLASFLGERPFGWGDFLGFTLTTMLLLFLVRSSLPAVITQRMLTAQAWGRYAELLRLTVWLRRLGGRARLSPLMDDYYRAKAEIGLGRVDEGLARFARHVTTAVQGAGASTLHGLHAALLIQARRFPEAVAAQRRAIEALPEAAQPWLDLALLEARLGAVEEAEAALAQGLERERSPMMEPFVRYIGGLIALNRGLHEHAARQLVEAIGTLDATLRNPLADLARAEMQAHLAVAALYLGRHQEAARLWRGALRLMQIHRYQEVMDRFAAAARGKPWAGVAVHPAERVA